MTPDFAPQSTCEEPRLHVAIVPDGNGRWALARGLARSVGHRAGVDAVCRVVRAAPGLGIGVLTLHAFSRANRRRPEPEVRSILACIRMFLELETRACAEEGVRVSGLGAREALPPELRRALDGAERQTLDGERLHLRLAIDYSARAAIRAALAPPEGPEAAPDAPPEPPIDVLGPDVDLLIRTGGEKRLSDFLLWESAYAELCFLDTPWPEFDERDLAAAVADFRRRERRFGGLPSATAEAARAGPLAPQPLESRDS